MYNFRNSAFRYFTSFMRVSFWYLSSIKRTQRENEALSPRVESTFTMPEKVGVEKWQEKVENSYFSDGSFHSLLEKFWFKFHTNFSLTQEDKAHNL